jgi:dihydroorotate dehydrogenase electron transfer subunit
MGTPAINPDSTISAIVQSKQPLAPAGTLLRLWLPVAYHEGGGFGRFFLARCTEDSLPARISEWSIYGRRALFCAGMPVSMPDQAGSIWEFLIPRDDDPGYQWLANHPLNTAINLLGPFGQKFELAAHTRALAVLADLQTLLLTLPVVQTMLDRGGRVILLIRGEADTAAPLLPLIPIPVEVRLIPPDTWLDHLSEPLRWADQFCAALPNRDYPALAHQIRTRRFQVDNAFAHVFVQSDLLCGIGACLACVVPTREGGYTRACVHGPVFPLSAIAS